MMMLSGCGSSADSASSDSNSSTESDSKVETGVGAMANADFAVTVLLETIWPIEGNDYAEPTLVEPWCTTYATDPNAAILSVTATYLTSKATHIIEMDRAPEESPVHGPLSVSKLY